MIVYRIARTEFCGTGGEGAKRYGGRWNFPGFAALYASSTISSALLERLTVDPELFAAERYILYSVMEIDCPDKLIKNLKPHELPNGWDAIPPQRISQELGTRLIQQGTLCFAVPSVVDKTSLNYVMNPVAKGFDKLAMKVYALEL
jgi:RES domain-containing protein